MAVSSPALPPEEQQSPTSGDAEMRQQPTAVHEIAATSGDANGSNNMQTTSANTPNPSPAEHQANAAKSKAAADGTSAPVQTVPAPATNSNPIIDSSSDAT